MKPFIGFSTDRHKTIRVPEGFFEDLLSQISSMLEMKLTLFLFWRLARGRTQGAQGSEVGGRGSGAGEVEPGNLVRTPRMVSLEELQVDDRLREALSSARGLRPFEEALCEGIELCVARGTLLQLRVIEEGESRQEGAPGKLWYVLNTKESRAWVDALAKGEIDVMATPLAEGYVYTNGHTRPPAPGPRPLRLIAERPNIFALYEQNIGLLTPLIAEQLQEAERHYPREWIEAAFEEAVSNNKRSWRYIEKILERWLAEGKESGKTRGPDERALDPDKYTKGKYAFLFRPGE